MAGHHGDNYFGVGGAVRYRHRCRSYHALVAYSLRGQRGFGCGIYNPTYVVYCGPNISNDVGY